MAPAGSQEVSAVPEKWPVVRLYGVLGHHISDTGTVRPSWTLCKQKMWRAFFGNFGNRIVKKVPVEQKVLTVKRAVQPLLTYKCSIWPPQVTLAKEIDGVQRKMISILAPTRRRPTEDARQHAKRQSRQANALARQTGLWSKYWFDRAVAWDGHVRRDHVGLEWNSKFLELRNSAWLRDQRALFAPSVSSRSNPWTIFAGRTGTRSSPGKVQARWEEAIEFAKAETF